MPSTTHEIFSQHFILLPSFGQLPLLVLPLYWLQVPVAIQIPFLPLAHLPLTANTVGMAANNDKTNLVLICIINFFFFFFNYFWFCKKSKISDIYDYLYSNIIYKILICYNFFFFCCSLSYYKFKLYLFIY